jgi:fructan beta-fructosidase
MRKQFHLLMLVMVILACHSVIAQNAPEKYRPLIHFTPKSNWMNDPNGMVYQNGVYHLFYQHNPNAAVWGPMHWGHATSKDLINWQHEPIAIYPDDLGTIFSGSAVYDKDNTSGFGKDGKAPLVAIYTQHDEKAIKAGRNDFQNQSIAYSLDDGKTWVKYSDNPVLRSSASPDFRDPKVMWHEPSKRWIMSLAVADHLNFYSSTNLKVWNRESEFGLNNGAHGGVWECPDLISFQYEGKTIWVLIVNINPGGPNKGSGTQYFVGDFDGHEFKPYSNDTKWLDFGPDNYAGVTWSNVADRNILAGWMSNWLYANIVPTETWRSGLTIPRELGIEKHSGEYYVTSKPVKELVGIQSSLLSFKDVDLSKGFDLMKRAKNASMPCQIDLQLLKVNNVELILSNPNGEELLVGFNKEKNEYYIDRSKSGKTDFHPDFAGVFRAPRISSDNKLSMSLLIDQTSVEVFADGGLSVMTGIFFPTVPFNKIMLRSSDGAVVNEIQYRSLKSILGK